MDGQSLSEESLLDLLTTPLICHVFRSETTEESLKESLDDKRDSLVVPRAPTRHDKVRIL
ncbi:hypothetical protein [Helicobacter marmotae]|uniref:hypothetical protein n=1 Tax=Helicobacter marmotae TaxID=152490 RepID=UPI00131516BF|nr:hypothetical protein [Helicobacter marmotae]